MHTISVIKINSVLMQYFKKIKINTRSKVLDFLTKTGSVLLLIFFNPQLYQAWHCLSPCLCTQFWYFCSWWIWGVHLDLKKILHQEAILRTALVVQWLRLCLPLQRTQVQSLVLEDCTSGGPAKPVCHSCRARALGAVFCDKRNHRKKPVCCE